MVGYAALERARRAVVTMRYDCDDPAFAGDFVEFSDSWSRAQVRAAWAAIPDSATIANLAGEGVWLDAIRPKVVALHLTCVGEQDAPVAPITDAAELTPERTEEVDTRLYTWFSKMWVDHMNGLSTLGNALGRQSSPSSATSN